MLASITTLASPASALGQRQTDNPKLAYTSPSDFAAIGITGEAAIADTQRTINAFIDANPGATRLSANRIQLENGVLVQYWPKGTASSARAPAGSEAEAPNCAAAAAWCPPAPCGYGWLCLFDAIFYGGSRLDLFHCGFVNIGAVYGWNDRVRSFINNQTPGTISVFYDWVGYWQWLYSTPHAPSANVNPPSRIWYTNGVDVC